MSEEPTAKLGPTHLTGKAPSKSHARSRSPLGPTSVIAAVERASLLPLAANCSPDDLFNHVRSPSLCVMPRLSVMFGHVIRPGSRCTKLFCPPSLISSVSTLTSSPLISMNRPISTPSTSTRKVEDVTRCRSKPSSGIEQRFPGACVHIGDELDEAGAVGMLEVEQVVEVPVKVIREVADLPPQRRLGVQLHKSASGVPLLRRYAGDFLDACPLARRRSVSGPLVARRL